jgi:hypothetical protein
MPAMEIFIFFLNVSTVLEHHIGKILRCIRTEDGALVALLVEQRDPSGVIHVSIRENHGIDSGLCIEEESCVLLSCLTAPTLEHAAV